MADPFDFATPFNLAGGRYIVDRLVDRIGAGCIYEARAMPLVRAVTVWMCAGPLAANEDFVSAFNEGVSRAAHLHHPAFATIFDSGLADHGAPYLVTEPRRGVTLAEAIRREPFTCARLASLAYQLLGAVAALEAQGLVHGNLSETTIELFGSRGDDGRPIERIRIFDLAFTIAMAQGFGPALGIEPEDAFENEANPMNVAAYGRTDLVAVGRLFSAVRAIAAPSKTRADRSIANAVDTVLARLVGRHAPAYANANDARGDLVPILEATADGRRVLAMGSMVPPPLQSLGSSSGPLVASVQSASKRVVSFVRGEQITRQVMATAAAIGVAAGFLMVLSIGRQGGPSDRAMAVGGRVQTPPVGTIVARGLVQGCVLTVDGTVVALDERKRVAVAAGAHRVGFRCVDGVDAGKVGEAKDVNVVAGDRLVVGPGGSNDEHGGP